jgi:hypothetical protein
MHRHTSPFETLHPHSPPSSLVQALVSCRPSSTPRAQDGQRGRRGIIIGPQDRPTQSLTEEDR